MRNNILSYLCLFLFSFTVFVLLSVESGFGYVYMQWRGWQLQSNVFLILLLFFIGSVLLYGFWYLLKVVLRKSLLSHRVPKSYQDLHPYERLGILWLLHAERVEKDNIIATYQGSVLLYPLIQSRILLNQNELELAKESLKQAKNPLFELSELIKAEISLAENNEVEVINRLNFLSVQPLSTWLSPVENAYQNELLVLWSQLAKNHPWLIFKAAKIPQFNEEQNLRWLKALLRQFDQVDTDTQALFVQWYESERETVLILSVDEQIIILKIMSQYLILNQQTHIFAQYILENKFVPEVLYIWLDQSLNTMQIDIQEIEQKISDWELRYAAQPSLTFAKWHIYQKQGEYDLAAELLSQYPEDVYMAYLRLQDVLKFSDSLQDDLKQLFKFSKQDFKLDL